MLPDWEFNGEEAKRRVFIRWVEAELDRFATLATGRYPQVVERDDWPTMLRDCRPTPQPVGHPANPLRDMNPLYWEFGLLRYMFRRYWPGRKRPISDPASAASIAVARFRRALPRAERTSDRLKVRAERSSERARMLFEEWERGTKSPGRRQAELDTAFLDTLPAHLFAC